MTKYIRATAPACMKPDESPFIKLETKSTKIKLITPNNSMSGVFCFNL